MDSKFDNLIRITFDLSDPRLIETKDTSVIKELSLLLQDLSNKPDCHWMAGSYPFKKDLLLSFTNSVVSFTVMVITTRIQINSTPIGQTIGNLTMSNSTNSTGNDEMFLA